jgi:predicted RNA-binding Zn ribbon-like protein
MNRSPFLDLGGAWILDLLNMGKDEPGAVDALSSLTLWTEWSGSHPSLIELPSTPLEAKRLEKLKATREHLRALMLSTVERKLKDSEWLKLRKELLVDAQAAPLLNAKGELSWRALNWSCVLELELSLFLNTADRSRIRQCANPRCTHLFYDTSKPGTRRWCDMGSCGNLDKVRRHRRRAAG